MKWNVLKRIIKNQILVSSIILIISFRIFIPIIVLYRNILAKCFNKEFESDKINNIFDCIKVIYNKKIIALIYVTIVLILFFMVFNIVYTRKRLKNENEGVKIQEKDGTHGTANFIKPQDIKELCIGKEEISSGILIGKTLDTDEIIVLPEEYKAINRNIMVWGASRFTENLPVLLFQMFLK